MITGTMWELKANASPAHQLTSNKCPPKKKFGNYCACTLFTFAFKWIIVSHDCWSF